MKIKIRQIWQENDSRFKRYVMIMAITENYIQIQTIDIRDFHLCGKSTRARRDRFNNKQGGYSLVAKNSSYIK